MIFLISCIAGVFGSFCRMPDSHHWSRHVDCWCVRQNLCAGGISNNFLLKNNDIWLYFWYSFLHLKFHFSCYCQKLSPLVWPVFLHSKNKKNSISYFFSRNLSGPGCHSQPSQDSVWAWLTEPTTQAFCLGLAPRPHHRRILSGPGSQSQPLYYTILYYTILYYNIV